MLRLNFDTISSYYIWPLNKKLHLVVNAGHHRFSQFQPGTRQTIESIWFLQSCAQLWGRKIAQELGEEQLYSSLHQGIARARRVDKRTCWDQDQKVATVK